MPRVFVHALAFSSTPSHADAAEFSSTPSHAALLQRHGAAAPHRAVMGIKRRPVERPVEHACAEAPRAPRNRRRLSACVAPVACSPPNRRIPGRLLRGRRHSTRHVTGRHLHERRHRDISAGEVTSSASCWSRRLSARARLRHHPWASAGVAEAFHHHPPAGMEFVSQIFPLDWLRTNRPYLSARKNLGNIFCGHPVIYWY